jgi:hypothetical protein
MVSLLFCNEYTCLLYLTFQDAIVSVRNGAALRQFASESLNEYLKWMIEQHKDVQVSGHYHLFMQISVICRNQL